MAQIKIENARLFFPVLFEPEQFKGQGKKRYTARLGVAKGSAQLAALEACIREVAQAAWPKDWQKKLEVFAGDKMKFCLLDGNKVDFTGAEGYAMLSTTRYESDGPPVLRDARNNPVVTNDGLFYSGCYVNAVVDVWAQTKDYPGVRCSLLGLQFYRDGDAFSGAGRLADDAFQALDDTGDAAGFDTPSAASLL